MKTKETNNPAQIATPRIDGTARNPHRSKVFAPYLRNDLSKSIVSPGPISCRTFVVPGQGRMRVTQNLAAFEPVVPVEIDTPAHPGHVGEEQPQRIDFLVILPWRQQSVATMLLKPFLNVTSLLLPKAFSRVLVDELFDRFAVPGKRLFRHPELAGEIEATIPEIFNLTDIRLGAFIYECGAPC